MTKKELLENKVFISIADFNSGFTESSEVVAFEAVHFADRLIEALYPEQIDNIVED